MENVQVWNQRRRDTWGWVSQTRKGGKGLRLLTSVARMLARDTESVACTGNFQPDGSSELLVVIEAPNYSSAGPEAASRYHTIESIQPRQDLLHQSDESVYSFCHGLQWPAT